MDRRHLLLAPVALLLPMPSAVAAEAAPVATSTSDQARIRLEARLQTQGYWLMGETRRKGDLIIVTANRSNIPWRLVVDGRTGEIVGQKPLSAMNGPD